MIFISGLALVLLAVAAFSYSMPRRGKTASFVGTEWEGYVVVLMIGALGIGLLLVIAGAAQLLKDIS